MHIVPWGAPISRWSPVVEVIISGKKDSLHDDSEVFTEDGACILGGNYLL
jgi:hypothetical protein